MKRIAVFNTYDATPSQNGGETRHLHLYRRLSRDNAVRLLAYDPRCTVAVQRTRMQPALEIVNCALTLSDRYKFFKATEQMGLFAHDVECIRAYEFSPQFLSEVYQAIDWAQIVVVTQPYLANLVFPACGSKQLKVFEGHNVEAVVKASFLADSRDPVAASRFVDDTIFAESLALREADIVVAVSRRDAELFSSMYDCGAAKIRVVPNGVDALSYSGTSAAAKTAFRRQAGLDHGPVGVFLGSAYGPNVDSYRMTRGWLDEVGFTGTILIIGKISDAKDDTWPKVSFRESWLGFVSEPVKRLMLSAADFALQIVVSGGGTNLKLFDYMAAGLPILANRFGTRGVADDGWFVPVDSVAELQEVVTNAVWSTPQAAAAAAQARRIAVEVFDWSRIAATYADVLEGPRSSA